MTLRMRLDRIKKGILSSGRNFNWEGIRAERCGTMTKA